MDERREQLGRGVPEERGVLEGRGVLDSSFAAYSAAYLYSTWFCSRGKLTAISCSNGALPPGWQFTATRGQGAVDSKEAEEA